MDDLKILHKKVRDKFNELRNVHKENLCLQEFIKEKHLDDEYYKFRLGYLKRNSDKNEEL